MPKKKQKPAHPEDVLPTVHDELKGFDIRVNTFGAMESSFEIDKLNDFLNKSQEKDEDQEKKDKKKR